MDALEQLRGAIPDAAKDIRLNLQAVLRGGALSEPQRWGVAAKPTPTGVATATIVHSRMAFIRR